MPRLRRTLSFRNRNFSSVVFVGMPLRHDTPQTSGAAQLALALRTHRAPPRNSNSARLTPPLFANYLRRRAGGGAQRLVFRCSEPVSRGGLLTRSGRSTSVSTQYTLGQQVRIAHSFIFERMFFLNSVSATFVCNSVRCRCSSFI